MGEEIHLADIFDRLDRWRHFPVYQLERHADIFLSFYLKDLLERQYGHTIRDVVVPEFPIKRDIVNIVDNESAKASELSINVDFVLFSTDGNAVHFVELKTD